MRIGYRAPAIALLVTLGALVAIGLLLPNLPSPTPESSTAPGTVSFDPCLMWRQVPWSERLSALVWLGSFVVLMLYAIGNSRARWWAGVNLITLALNIHYQYAWTSSSCYTTQDVALSSIWVAALALICLQHIFSERR